MSYRVLDAIVGSLIRKKKVKIPLFVPVDDIPEFRDRNEPEATVAHASRKSISSC